MAPMKRVSVLLGHLDETRTDAPLSELMTHHCNALASVGQPARNAPDDVVIVSALRTPLCKAKKGGFKDTMPDDLLATVLSAVTERTGVDKSSVGDIVVGSVLGDGSQRAIQCRIASLLTGFPEEVPIRTVNRQCSSGLQAIADVAAAIKSGYYDVGIGAGVESMTTNPMKWDGGVNPKVETHAAAASCLLPMGITSENVAEAFGVTRNKQDSMAARSHARAASAAKAHKFDAEIVPVVTKVKDKATGLENEVVISADDGIRAGVTAAQLAKLRPAFKPNGTTTAGNASQVTDGAAAVLMMKRSEAERRGLQILGTFRAFAAVGCDPAVMGIGPAVAIPEACKKAGISVKDIDLFELNEAFASQASYCCEKLGLDEEKVNVNSGAIALGHPLGATGARCAATLLHEMNRRGPSCRYGVVSMCIGSGMGAAAVFENC
mmetsp:Transcript_8811/g.20000  ORF Transcript_8811/g.20000 Transcript_8811/m.20000 type:complete len:436 (-) Transcript_8811:157-1464(-)